MEVKVVLRSFSIVFHSLEMLWVQYGDAPMLRFLHGLILCSGTVCAVTGK